MNQPSDFRCPECGLQIGNVTKATCSRHGPMEKVSPRFQKGGVVSGLGQAFLPGGCVIKKEAS